MGDEITGVDTPAAPELPTSPPPPPRGNVAIPSEGDPGVAVVLVIVDMGWLALLDTSS